VELPPTLANSHGKFIFKLAWDQPLKSAVALSFKEDNML